MTYTAAVWDRASSINGVDAATVLESRADIGDGPVLLVKNDETVVIFQPTDPEQPDNTPLTPERIAVLGPTMVDMLQNPPAPEPSAAPPPAP